MLDTQAKNGIQLKVMIPGKNICDVWVQSVTFPTDNGEICILPGHAEMFTHVGYGVLSFIQNGENKFYALEEGIAHISSHEVRILADGAEEALHIDSERAKKALQRAQERLKGSIDNRIDLQRAAMAEQRAQARLDAVTRHSVLKK